MLVQEYLKNKEQYLRSGRKCQELIGVEVKGNNNI